MSTEYKLCILAAGRGTRNKLIPGLHKALLPLENKSVISRIIEGVPKDIEIVIPVGYEAEQVKTFLNTVYTDRKITFVDVENFDGPCSGPGLSLLMCEPHLQCPFIFTSADTIVEDVVPYDRVDYDWIGVSMLNADEASKYCLVKPDPENVYMDELYYGSGTNVYNGRAGIHDYKTFWDSLKNNTLINGEHQVINGFVGLRMKMKPFIWYDTGNDESYEATRKLFKEVVAQKNDEVLYIENKKVIKYFADPNRIEDRIQRVKFLNNTVPSVTKINDNMYCYDLVEGDMLSTINDESALSGVLYFLHERLGKKIFLKTEQFLSDCSYMYRKKTYGRCSQYSGTELDNIEYINGVKVDKINNLLKEIDWDSIYAHATPTYFHGDFQPENIIYNGDYTLIDWRDKFGMSLEVGDFYYDLGKLYHGIFINGTDVSHQLYEVKINNNKAEFSYHTRSNLLSLLNSLETFCKNNGFSFENVEILGILQYIGISSLYNNFHDGEYGRFLFLFGKYLLTKYLEK